MNLIHISNNSLLSSNLVAIIRRIFHLVLKYGGQELLFSDSFEKEFRNEENHLDCMAVLALGISAAQPTHFLM